MRDKFVKRQLTMQSKKSMKEVQNIVKDSINKMDQELSRDVWEWCVFT